MENKTQTVEERYWDNVNKKLDYRGDIRKHDCHFSECEICDLKILAEYNYKFMKKELNSQIQQSNEVTGETSDGYHTFNELYEFRKLYNAGLFNEWSNAGLFNVHKSKKHSDGEECFGGGWFIVMATLPTGQISNHYELKDWDLFQCKEREKADVWDGHTAQDVSERLKAFIEQYKLERAKDNE